MSLSDYFYIFLLFYGLSFGRNGTLRIYFCCIDFNIAAQLQRSSKLSIPLVYFMSCTKKNGFCKSANCPLSKDLLAFQRGELQARERERISIHLRFCEFCAAETEFYAHYPQADETIEKTEIPQPLLELAEALLTNRHNDISALNKLLSEADELLLQTN